MGIRFSCPNGHKLHVKEYLAGKRGVCPNCGAKILIPSPQGSPEQAPPASAAPRANVERGGRAPSQRDAESGSQSVVISIVEPSRAPLARPATKVPATVPEPITSPAPDLVSTNVTSPPVDVPLPRTAVSPSPTTTAAIGNKTGDTPSAESVADSTTALPVSRYAARRMRNRRKQTTLAVALLIAVVVLAALLVVVLWNQGATTNESNLARMARFHSLDDGWLMAEPRATSQFIAVSAQTNGGAADSDSAAQIA